ARAQRDGSLVFTGKMDFRPNVDGVLWFFERVWPRVREQLPEARFVVVGRNPSPRLRALRVDPRAVVTGTVPDVRPYLRQAQLYVVPLRMGGGTRLKVLEAMAMGKPIVSTSLGCEGIDLIPGRELIVADRAEDFSQWVIDLWQDEWRRRELARRARQLVEERYDWRGIAPRLEAAYLEATSL
ncbi:MAG: glycosyltransferase, partial [Chloroflexi bacterium]|nr:glycosyltransferase [Chloroflexota bacterium]